ncbi:MAG: N-acetyltransferase [Elusimicrobia bacterium]|nr:N-acetyltransferase [Elusimicrobiota bacterium]
MGRIRLATKLDAQQIRAIYAPIVIKTAISFEVSPPSAAEMKRRISTILPQYPWLVEEEAGKIRGYAYASRHRDRAAYQWAVDLAVYVREGCRGIGIGRRLYVELFKILRAQGLYAAYAGLALPNPANVALHESMGMRPVGIYDSVGYKLGRWHDVGWWQLSLQDRRAAPRPPRMLSKLTM